MFLLLFALGVFGLCLTVASTYMLLRMIKSGLALQFRLGELLAAVFVFGVEMTATTLLTSGKSEHDQMAWTIAAAVTLALLNTAITLYAYSTFAAKGVSDPRLRIKALIYMWLSGGATAIFPILYAGTMLLQ